MEKLSKSWFVEGPFDLEHKKYVLLAYLQEVSQKFTKTELYPHLSELVSQYRNLETFLSREKDLYNQFPTEIKGLDWHNFKVAYQKVIEDEELMRSIRTIIEWSLPKMEASLKEGREIHDFIEQNINIKPVGVEPISKEEGYLLIQNAEDPTTKVFSYEIALFERSEARYRSVKTKFLSEYKRNFVNTINSIKGDLIRQFKHLPNPATYAIESEIKVPLRPTLLPIAKKLLIRELS